MKPQMDADERGLRRRKLSQLTEEVIGCAFTVSNTLGCGFLEKVYENALAHQIRKAELQVQQQYGVRVHYDGVTVGEYAADLLVEGVLLVELKAVREFDDIHLAQCLNYLKATGLPLCLLMNFANPRVKIRRIANNY